MTVNSILRAYEENGKETSAFDPAPVINISSHGIYDDRVVLTTPDGKSYTLLVNELIAAVMNARNFK